MHMGIELALYKADAGGVAAGRMRVMARSQVKRQRNGKGNLDIPRASIQRILGHRQIQRGGSLSMSVLSSASAANALNATSQCPKELRCPIPPGSLCFVIISATISFSQVP